MGTAALHQAPARGTINLRALVTAWRARVQVPARAGEVAFRRNINGCEIPALAMY
jgi:hypothetical protein